MIQNLLSSLDYRIEYEVAAVFYNLIFIVYLYKKFRVDSVVNRRFRHLMVIITAATIFDIVTAIVTSMAGAVSNPVHMVVNTIDCFGAVVTTSYYSYYIMSYVENDMIRLYNRLFYLAMLLTYVVIMVVNFANGIVFSYSDQGQYIHGKHFFLMCYLYPAIFIFWGTLFYLIKIKDYEKKQRLSIGMALVLTGMLYSIQMFYSDQVLLTFFAASVGLVIVFFSLETPDYMRLNKTLVELDKAREAACKANEEMQEVSRLKTEFIENMSRELRNPVNAIIGYNDLIISKTEESETAENAINVKAASSSLLSLFNDIINYINMSSEHISLESKSYDTETLIYDNILYGKFNSGVKHLDFIFNSDSMIPKKLKGDASKITEIFNGLLSNSVKYTLKGSISVNIMWTAVDEKSGILTYVISDTGIGFTDEELNRINQGDELDNKSSDHGLGLGLPVVRKLLNLMDSHLDIMSAYGAGSTFTFDICQEIVDDTPLGEIKLDNNDLSSYWNSTTIYPVAPEARVLLCDSNAISIEVMKKLLQISDVSYDEASNEQEAAALLVRNKYDLIFINQDLFTFGYDQFLKYKIESANIQTPLIIILSDPNADKGDYLMNGFDAYLDSPLKINDFFGTLFTYMSKDKIRETVETHSMERIIRQAEKNKADSQMIEQRYKEDEEGGIRGLGQELDGKRTVMLVDDEFINRQIAENFLSAEYNVVSMSSGRDCLDSIRQVMPDCLLLDLKLPDMSGFDVIKALRSDEELKEIPVVFLTAIDDREMEVKCLTRGAADFIKKPFVSEIMLSRLHKVIELSYLKKHLMEEVINQVGRSERLTDQIMQALAGTVDAKDAYTNGHSARVAIYAKNLASCMGKSEKEQREIVRMGLLHDIGKIGIPDAIINKQDKLTDEEYELIKQHPKIGYEILKTINEMPGLAVGARWHHERYDGSGYPDGLKGYEIPEEARIICVADAYDAMTSKRAYSKSKTQEQVRNEFVRCAGSQFDPEIADVMLELIDEDTNYDMREK